METKLAFNLNEYVWVKLLSKGYARWQEFYHYMPAEWQKPLAHYEAKADADGYCKFQLWEFMQIFGPAIHLSVVGLFETDIVLQQKDLRPTLPTPGPAPTDA
jgi:hypothetical protein